MGSRIRTRVIPLVLAVIAFAANLFCNAVTARAADPTISYTTHVQDVGWQDWVKNGKQAGTTGRSLRLEGIKIKISDTGYSGGIRYRTHVQDVGTMGWVKDGELSGTTGRSLRLEGIWIELTGEVKDHYDIYYRVHVQDIGWQEWKKNGEMAGTSGRSLRLEGIEIKLVAKDDLITYRTHVQNVGWQNWVNDGATAGTSGRSLRIEAFECKLNVPGGVEYRGWVEGATDWQEWVSNGGTAGTSGQSRRIERFEMRLTGAAAENYDIYYRVHVQDVGWLSWGKNGETVGTKDMGKRIEAIQILLVPKGGSAPNPTDVNFAGPYVSELHVAYRSTVDGGNFSAWKKDGATCGNTSKVVRTDSLQIRLENNVLEGSIQYRAHVQDIGWMDWVSDGATVGSSSKNKRIEAIEIKLTGQLADCYTVWYRSYVEGIGWRGWTCNGLSSGSMDYGLRLQAVEIRILPKGAAAPGDTAARFYRKSYIYIDAGHGLGSSTSGVIDPGASGNGYLEYELTEELATMVAERAKNTYGLNVYLNVGTNVNFRQRQADASSRNCTAFLSIHFNAFSNSTSTGSESYIHSLRAAPGSDEFQSIIHPHLIAGMGIYDRGKKDETFAVCGGEVPATLIEVCFITNPQDMKTYQENKEKLADELALGLYEASRSGF